MFSIEKGLKRGYCLSAIFCNIFIKEAIEKINEKWKTGVIVQEKKLK